MNNKVLAFINSHKMNPQDINPAVCGKAVCEHMLSGLNGKVIDMPMIRTYLTADGDVPKGINAIVIDAGGTNFRSGLATFTDDGCSITNLAVSEMPGKTEPIGWDAFISFLVDRIVWRVVTSATFFSNRFIMTFPVSMARGHVDSSMIATMVRHAFHAFLRPFWRCSLIRTMQI